ncbi:hypothetical protein MKEN_00748500 [Mycena kentingensis (nom. inval.)]|nr:hypothetical protein MKEN_00748500 [Mycena kentingensis (nom. inval.)]
MQFTVRASSLTAAGCRAFLNERNIDIPEDANAKALKDLVKAELQANPGLVRIPDYAPLFTVSQRNSYFARASLTPSNPETWNGIGGGPAPPDDISQGSHPEDVDLQDAPVLPVDHQRAADLQFLQGLDSTQLRAFIQASTNANNVNIFYSKHSLHIILASTRSLIFIHLYIHSNPRTLPIISFPPLSSLLLTLVTHSLILSPALSSGLGSRRRPARQLGLTASTASALAPDRARKIFADGLKTHLPMHYLTDRACAPANAAATAKEMDDFLGIETGVGIVKLERSLPFAPERQLSLGEWYSCHKRWMSLCWEFLPEEAPLWEKHFQLVLSQTNLNERWPLICMYDSEVRRQAVTTQIDPSEFHLVIWNECETAHLAQITLDTIRAEMLTAPASVAPLAASSISTAPSTFSPPAAPRSRPAPYSRNGRPAQNIHSSRNCNAATLVSGRTAILRRNANGPGRSDSQGTSYCFAFNGMRGCNNGATCNSGKHCGATRSDFPPPPPISTLLTHTPSNFLPVVTPLRPDRWELHLRAANLYDTFADVPRGLREGFDFGQYRPSSSTSDASTSWGIGVVFDGVWDAWKLAPGWNRDPERKIGWAEMVAVELGLRLAVRRDVREVHLHLRSDNQGVIGSLDAGKARNSEQNAVLRRIVSLMRSHSIWLSTTYVPSTLNLADRPSRGLDPDPPLPRNSTRIKIPSVLAQFFN